MSSTVPARLSSMVAARLASTRRKPASAGSSRSRGTMGDRDRPRRSRPIASRRVGTSCASASQAGGDEAGDDLHLGVVVARHPGDLEEPRRQHPRRRRPARAPPPRDDLAAAVEATSVAHGRGDRDERQQRPLLGEPQQPSAERARRGGRWASAACPATQPGRRGAVLVDEHQPDVAAGARLEAEARRGGGARRRCRAAPAGSPAAASTSNPAAAARRRLRRR